MHRKCNSTTATNEEAASRLAYTRRCRAAMTREYHTNRYDTALYTRAAPPHKPPHLRRQVVVERPGVRENAGPLVVGEAPQVALRLLERFISVQLKAVVTTAGPPRGVASLGVACAGEVAVLRVQGTVRVVVGVGLAAPAPEKRFGVVCESVRGGCSPGRLGEECPWCRSSDMRSKRGSGGGGASTAHKIIWVYRTSQRRYC